jgi:replicative DNA helicase
VVYYTLELGAEVVGRRVDASITDIALDDLKDQKELVQDRIKDKAKGQLIIKKYPMNRASVTTLSNHMERLRRTEFIPDIVMVDYLDLLKPVVHRKDKITELEEISQDLKGMGEVFECAVWTASQINREGNKANLVTINDVAAAFSKLFAADFVLAITRTIKQQNEDKATYMIGKNRNGPNSIIFDGEMDTAKVNVSFGNRRGFDEFQQEAEEQTQQQTAALKKRIRDKMKNTKSDFSA